MTIEFCCPFCQKLLKTPDEKAGVQANCPGCGEAVTVPSPQHEAGEVDPSRETLERGFHTPRGEPGATSGAGVTPRADDTSSDETKPCPMCGAEIKLTAKRCRFCGENILDRESDAERGPIDAGDVLTRSWEIYQKNLWTLVGASLVMLGIGIVAVGVGYAGMAVALMFVIGNGPGPQGPDAIAVVAFVTFFVLFMLFLIAIQAFVQGGYNILIIRTARGEQPQFGDLFLGSPFFWRLFLGNLLFTILMYAGMAACIVPGVFVILMFWPFSFVIVDQDTGVIESFQKSKELTNGNLATVFLLGLAATGINMLGEMACFVGLFFSIPLCALIFAVAYCRMAGLPTAGARQPSIVP